MMQSSGKTGKFTEYLWVPAPHNKWVFWCGIGKYCLHFQDGWYLITWLLK